MNFKNKLFGAALAASMITGAVIPAMAATITIENMQQGVTYNAYKIFTVDHKNSDGYAYTIHSNDPWYSDVTGYMDSHSDQLKLTATAKDKDLYVVEQLSGFNAPEFAEYLKEHLAGKTASASTVEGSNVIETEDPGYYLVLPGTASDPSIEVNAALGSLITIDDSFTIVDKNAQTLTKEFKTGREEEFVAIGDTVTYVIRSNVPYKLPTDNNYTFEIYDVFPAGLTYKNDMKIQIGTTELEEDQFSVEPYEKQNADETTESGYKITIPIADNTNVGQSITIEYSGIVNNQIVDGITDSNNPGNPNRVYGKINEKELSSSVSFYTATAKIVKVDGADHTNTLPGAVFTLQNDEGKFYYEDEQGNVSWVDASGLDGDYKNLAVSKGAYRVTPEDGELTFKGLDADKDYTLVELKAPTGYNLRTENTKIDFGEGNFTAAGNTLVISSQNVENFKGVQLPETGGMGTTLFYAVGGTLTAGAVVILITKKRMETAE